MLSNQPVAFPQNVAGTSPAGHFSGTKIVLVLALMSLAFLLASTPARSSAIWLQLAEGRKVASGLGFAETREPDALTGFSQGWLSNLMFFAMDSRFGGTGLVIFKAVLIAFLPLLMLYRLPGVSWRHFIGVFLSLLVLAPWLACDSVCFSYLGCALLSRLLNAGNQRPPATWLIAPVFVIWVNVDRWFFVGLFILFLDAAGRTLERSNASHRTVPHSTWRIFLIAVLACLINPAHFWVFDIRSTLGLSETAHLLRADSLIRELGALPNQGQFWSGRFELKIGEVAYLLLVVASALSFLFNQRARPVCGFLVWSGLLLSTLFFPTVIPFFAISAGPILANNMRDDARNRNPSVLPSHSLALPAIAVEGNSTARRRKWAFVAGSIMALFLFLVIDLMAWVGWLQTAPYQRREWLVQTDPSLREAALQLQEWHDDGTLNANDTIFCLNPEAAQTMAWFAPDVRTLPNPQLTLATTTQLREYLDLREALVRSNGTSNPRLPDWNEQLRTRNVNWVLLHETNQSRFTQAFIQFLNSPNDWRLIYERGRVVIFVRRDVQSKNNSRLNEQRTVDLKQRAYQPAESDLAPSGTFESQFAPNPHWSDLLTKHQPARSIHRDQALLYLLQYELYRPSVGIENLRQTAVIQAASVVALPQINTSWGYAVDAKLRIQVLQRLVSDNPASNSGMPDQLAEQLARRLAAKAAAEGPLPQLILAIRSARQAIVENRQNPDAYLALGDAYLHLMATAHEAEWASRLPLLGRIRKVQVIAAFNQTLLLDPDQVHAHLSLARLFHEMGYLDLALKHYRSAQQRLNKLGRQGSESGEAFDQKMKNLEATISKLTPEVERLQKEYEANVPNMKLLDKARLAGEKRLPENALKMLMDSDYNVFGPSGLYMEMDLLLTTGKVAEVYEWLVPEHRSALGDNTYFRLLAQLDAAIGEYDKADQNLKKLMESFAESFERNEDAVDLRRDMSIILGFAVLEGSCVGNDNGLRFLFNLKQHEVLRRSVQSAHLIRQQNDILVIRGILAMEKGDIAAAKSAFEEAVGTWKSLDAFQSGGGIDFAARPIAQECLQFLAR